MSPPPLLLVAALGLEIRPLLRSAQGVSRVAGLRGGWHATVGRMPCVVFRGGVGPAAVERSATTLAAAMPEVAGLVNVGLCGALDPTLRLADCVAPDTLVDDAGVHYTVDPELRAQVAGPLGGATGLTVSHPVWSAAAKAELRSRTLADCCEMEGAAWATAAAAQEWPFAAVRAVSDVAAEDLPDLGRLADPAASAWSLARLLDPRVAMRLPGLARRATLAARALAAHLVSALA